MAKPLTPSELSFDFRNYDQNRVHVPQATPKHVEKVDKKGNKKSIDWSEQEFGYQHPVAPGTEPSAQVLGRLQFVTPEVRVSQIKEEINDDGTVKYKGNIALRKGNQDELSLENFLGQLFEYGLWTIQNKSQQFGRRDFDMKVIQCRNQLTHPVFDPDTAEARPNAKPYSGKKIEGVKYFKVQFLDYAKDKTLFMTPSGTTYPLQHFLGDKRKKKNPKPLIGHFIIYLSHIYIPYKETMYFQFRVATVVLTKGTAATISPNIAMGVIGNILQKNPALATQVDDELAMEEPDLQDDEGDDLQKGSAKDVDLALDNAGRFRNGAAPPPKSGGFPKYSAPGSGMTTPSQFGTGAPPQQFGAPQFGGLQQAPGGMTTQAIPPPFTAPQSGMTTPGPNMQPQQFAGNGVPQFGGLQQSAPQFQGLQQPQIQQVQLPGQT